MIKAIGKDKADTFWDHKGSLMRMLYSCVIITTIADNPGWIESGGDLRRKITSPVIKDNVKDTDISKYILLHDEY